jgi:hypothetical protein
MCTPHVITLVSSSVETIKTNLKENSLYFVEFEFLLDKIQPFTSLNTIRVGPSDQQLGLEEEGWLWILEIFSSLSLNNARHSC